MNDDCDFHDDVVIDYCPLCKIEQLEVEKATRIDEMIKHIETTHHIGLEVAEKWIGFLQRIKTRSGRIAELEIYLLADEILKEIASTSKDED